MDPRLAASLEGRYLLPKRAGAEANTIVMHNWGRELRGKMAAKK